MGPVEEGVGEICQGKKNQQRNKALWPWMCENIPSCENHVVACVLKKNPVKTRMVDTLVSTGLFDKC